MLLLLLLYSKTNERLIEIGNLKPIETKIKEICCLTNLLIKNKI